MIKDYQYLPPMSILIGIFNSRSGLYSRATPKEKIVLNTYTVSLAPWMKVLISIAQQRLKIMILGRMPGMLLYQ